MTGEIIITSLQSGVPQGTDETPAVDTIDTTMAATGTTKKYLRSDELTWLLDRFGYITLNPVNVATTGNLLANYANGASGVGATLTAEMLGILTIDGVDLTSVPATSVLVKDQTDPSQNGIYLVTNAGTLTTNWVLTRSPEFNQTSNILNKMPVFVNYGTVNADTLWISDVVTPVTVGTTAILFNLFASVSSVVTLPLAMSQGGTSAALSPVNNSLIYSTASEMALLSPVASRLMVTDGSGNISWSLTLPSGVVITGYLPLTGGTMSGDINMGGFKATNAADPTNPQDYATKSYIDANALTGTQVYAATTVTLNATQAGAGVGATLTDASGTFSAFSVDGTSPPLGSEILDKDQTNAAHQGIYTLTTNGDGISVPWVLTRSVNYDTPAQINATGLIVVQNGSTQAGTLWYNSTSIVTVDTTNFSYVQYGASFLSSTLASGKIFRGNVSNVAVASTSSFADTYSASQLLYSNGANTVVGLATANNGVLVTDAGGVPSISSTLPSGLTIPGFAKSGANADITSLTGLTGTIQAPSGVTSSAGLPVLTFVYTASAVNYIQLLNNTTGSNPALSAVGSDTNITFQLNGKGTGGVAIFGVSTNSNAVIGQVGEFISSVISASSAVTATKATAINVTSISLSAGDWDVWGNITLTAVGVAYLQCFSWVSATSATLPDLSLFQGSALLTGTLAALTGANAPQRRFSLSTTTTIYLGCYADGTSGNGAVCGGIYARRVR